jgi:exonuclease III
VEQIYQANDSPKQAGVAILILVKVDFKPKLIRGDNGHFMLIKEAMHQEEITIFNLYAPNVSAHKFKTDPNTVAVGNFNIPLSTTDCHPEKKINKEILELNDTINVMDLKNVYRVFYPATTQYTFFSTAHGYFSKIEHIFRNKASLNKHKKIKITLCIQFDHTQ